ncbi:MAG: DNA-protecting protein DprA [Lachnospiraceae bacterium]|nr:DNA-protecting protein DprA [Lachnospiraceae bacterium]
MNEKAYYYWLVNIPKLKAESRRVLLKTAGTAKEVYNLSEKWMAAVLDEEQLERVKKGKASWDIEGEYEKLKQKNIRFTAYGLRDYPSRLLHIPSPPAALYYKGELPKDSLPSVAIVGARRCSEYGSYVAKEFGSKLGAAGIQIISGLAIGIDGISQNAAATVGAESFGVLGCGVDICYPRCNRAVYEKIMEKGGVLSEFPPGTEPRAQNFPSRNRIISGLADLVLVVEAKEKSGTSITVDMALEQGREVYAVPGRVTDELSKGCHKLIRQGAGIASAPEDIISALYYEETALAHGKKSIKESDFLTDNLTEKEKAVWSVLDRLPQDIQEIQERLKKKKTILSIQETMAILMDLSVREVITAKNGGYMKKEVFL